MAVCNIHDIEGTHKIGFDKLAHEIGTGQHKNILKLFDDNGSVYENHPPEKAKKDGTFKPISQDGQVFIQNRSFLNASSGPDPMR